MTFNVQAPVGSVAVAVSLSNVSRATVNPQQLLFTPDNWSVAQLVCTVAHHTSQLASRGRCAVQQQQQNHQSVVQAVLLHVLPHLTVHPVTDTCSLSHPSTTQPCVRCVMMQSD